MDTIDKGRICMAYYQTKSGEKKGKFLIYRTKKRMSFGLLILKNVDFKKYAHNTYMRLPNGYHVLLNRIYELNTIDLLDEHLDEDVYEAIDAKATQLNEVIDYHTIICNQHEIERERPCRVTKIIYAGKTSPK